MAIRMWTSGRRPRWGACRPHLTAAIPTDGVCIYGEGAVAGRAEAATSFASGMAASSNILCALLRQENRVVSVKDTYGGTNKLFLEFRRAPDKVECATRPTMKPSRRRLAKGLPAALPGESD